VMADKKKKIKQLTIYDVIADESKKRDCDCWLDVGRCFCYYPINKKT